MADMDTNIETEKVEVEQAEKQEGQKDKRKPFIPKSKDEIKAMSRLEQAQYAVDRSKYELKRVRSIESKSDRKNDTHKKILCGVALLAATKDAADSKNASSILNKYITSDRDRKFLGLEPIGKNANSSIEDQE